MHFFFLHISLHRRTLEYEREISLLRSRSAETLFKVAQRLNFREGFSIYILRDVEMGEFSAKAKFGKTKLSLKSLLMGSELFFLPYFWKQLH